MTEFRRIIVALCLGLAAALAQAQQISLRELPKDVKSGSLTHLTEMVFTLDGRRVKLAPGGIVRGANNLILTPNMVPANSLVSYQLDSDGQISRAWILTRDEAAKAKAGTRYTWQTSPETGTSISSILSGNRTPATVAQPGQRGQAPGFMQQLPAADTQQPVTDGYTQ